MNVNGVKRTERFEMRLRPHEREWIERAAVADRERMAVWVRDTVVTAAKARLAQETR